MMLKINPLPQEQVHKAVNKDVLMVTSKWELYLEYLSEHKLASN